MDHKNSGLRLNRSSFFSRSLSTVRVFFLLMNSMESYLGRFLFWVSILVELDLRGLFSRILRFFETDWDLRLRVSDFLDLMLSFLLFLMSWVLACECRLVDGFLKVMTYGLAFDEHTEVLLILSCEFLSISFEEGAQISSMVFILWREFIAMKGLQIWSLYSKFFLRVLLIPFSTFLNLSSLEAVSLTVVFSMDFFQIYLPLTPGFTTPIFIFWLQSHLIPFSSQVILLSFPIFLLLFFSFSRNSSKCLCPEEYTPLNQLGVLTVIRALSIFWQMSSRSLESEGEFEEYSSLSSLRTELYLDLGWKLVPSIAEDSDFWVVREMFCSCLSIFLIFLQSCSLTLLKYLVRSFSMGRSKVGITFLWNLQYSASIYILPCHS